MNTKNNETGSTNDGVAIISYLRLRKTIGWLGVSLPFTLLIVNFLINRFNVLNRAFFINPKCSMVYKSGNQWKSSISHYYYSTAGELFTGVLIAVALFMFCYKGHKKRRGEKGLSDNALTNLTGIFALGVVVFPTSSEECITDNLRVFLSSECTGYIHFTMASLFFICLAIMSMVNFRRTADQVSFGLKKQHKLFLLCGYMMLSSLALIFVYSVWIEGSFRWLDNCNPVFCLEAIALVFFGISWLGKGQVDFSYLPKKLHLIK
ncbi:DUF998 domain-containing protein [Fluviicola sp.]|uniref:DUF7103 family protein n=1 Tax=Fluviicola sp. TaxID=1917219 RepID=UPI0031D3FD72